MIWGTPTEADIFGKLTAGLCCPPVRRQGAFGEYVTPTPAKNNIFMIFIKSFLSVILLLIFFQASAQHKIVVIGKIANYKAGASVVSNKNGHYYVLEGLNYWDEKMIGKTIKVWGTFKLEKETKFVVEPGYPIPQHFFGNKRVILNAKWKLLKK